MAASLNVGVGGAWKPATALFVGVAGAWKNVQTAYVGVAGVWQAVFVYFSLVASPSSVSGHRTGTGGVDTASTTATATGGTAPITYAWSRLTDSGDNMTASAPTAATTLFGAASVTTGTSATSTWQCVGTDANGFTATSNVVTATVTAS